MSRPVHSVAFVCMGLLTACSGTKYATTERPLFAGYTVEWETPPVSDRKDVTHELEAVVEPAPNNRVLGMRPTVALYNAIKEPREPKGLKNLLKNKIGSAPVYLEQVPLADINTALVNRMNNHGYFSAQSRYEVKNKGRTATVTFFLNAGIPHRLREILVGDSTDTLSNRIILARHRSLIKPGDLYDLGTLQQERLRVLGTLQNTGFYRLGEDDLVFFADTSVGDHQVDVLLRVKPTTSDAKRQRYKLGRVQVHGDYDAFLPANDTTVIDSVRYINYLNNYRPLTIVRGVFLRPGEWYSARRTEQTSRYLASYGVFRSTTVNYTDDSAHAGVLDADILLVPQKRWSLFSELNATSKSNNFAGPGVRVGFKDRDLFRGAEILTTDLNGRFETQIAGPGKGTNAYELGMKFGLRIPRTVPFHFLRSTRSSVPTTQADIGYGLFRRIGLYGIESFNTSFGYLWHPNPRAWHDARLLDVSYSSLYYSSDAFNAFLDTNAVIRRSFREQFIVGMSYTYTVSTARASRTRSYALFSVGIDEGGNLLTLINRASGPRPPEGDLLFGQRFSQFVRLRPEVRYYRAIGGKGDQLVTRVLVNVAEPYGNSSVVPYVKQFFVGGTNSVRAFPARSVGPGTYLKAASSGVLIDQVGDIKFEANVEYRFTLKKYFKGALFADAGNIWLVNDDPERPGGQFHLQRALDELAMGAGVGLRFDPDVIVVRLDLATPLHDPALPIGDRWVFDDLKPRLLDNVVLNIAIGYPF
jgi:outer membrane protein insertion porin family